MTKHSRTTKQFGYLEKQKSTALDIYDAARHTLGVSFRRGANKGDQQTLNLETGGFETDEHPEEKDR